MSSIPPSSSTSPKHLLDSNAVLQEGTNAERGVKKQKGEGGEGVVMQAPVQVLSPGASSIPKAAAAAAATTRDVLSSLRHPVHFSPTVSIQTPSSTPVSEPAAAPAFGGAFLSPAGQGIPSGRAVTRVFSMSGPAPQEAGGALTNLLLERAKRQGDAVIKSLFSSPAAAPAEMTFPLLPSAEGFQLPRRAPPPSPRREVGALSAVMPPFPEAASSTRAPWLPSLEGFSQRDTGAVAVPSSSQGKKPAAAAAAAAGAGAGSDSQQDFMRMYMPALLPKAPHSLAALTGTSGAPAAASSSFATPSPPPMGSPEPQASALRRVVADPSINYRKIAWTIENTLTLPKGQELAFLGTGEFQNAYTLKADQPALVGGVDNGALVVKHFKMQRGSNVKQQGIHEGHLSSGYYAVNQQRTFAILRTIETEHYRFAKIYNDPLVDGFSVCEKVTGDTQAITAVIARAKDVETEEQLLEVAPEMSQVQALFTFALKLAFDQGEVIDLAKTDNVLFESVGDKKRLVVIDLYELQDGKSSALLHIKRGLKAFAGHTATSEHNLALYAYLAKDFLVSMETKKEEYKIQVGALAAVLKAEIPTWQETPGTTFSKKMAAKRLLASLPLAAQVLREKVNQYHQMLDNLEKVEEAIEALSS